MKRRTRRDTETFSMSFLDCICCGFGAIILLLVLNEFGEPIQLEQQARTSTSRSSKMEKELFDIRGMSVVLERELRARIEQLTEEQRRLARLRGDLSTVEGQHKASTEEEDALKKLTETLGDGAALADRRDRDLQRRAGAGLRAAGRGRADRQRVRHLHRRHFGLDAVAELALRRAEAGRGAEHLPEAQGHPGDGRRGRVHVHRVPRQVDPGLAGAPQGDPRSLPRLAGVLELEPVRGNHRRGPHVLDQGSPDQHLRVRRRVHRAVDPGSRGHRGPHQPCRAAPASGWCASTRSASRSPASTRSTRACAMPHSCGS